MTLDIFSGKDGRKKNRKQRLRDLNQKGDEGNDMDAFTDGVGISCYIYILNVIVSLSLLENIIIRRHSVYCLVDEVHRCDKIMPDEKKKLAIQFFFTPLENAFLKKSSKRPTPLENAFLKKSSKNETEFFKRIP